MVCDPDYSFLALIADEFNLILDVQNRLGIFLASCVPDLTFHSSRVSFFSIFTQICKLHPLFPMSIYRYRTLEVFLAPSFRTAMQAIGSIIGMEQICFSIEIVYLCVLHAVGGTADGLAKIGGIM